MTTLSKPVTRKTRKTVNGRPVAVTLAPAGSQDEALIGIRLVGTRTRYVVALSDLFRVAAMWHGQKEASAKREARKNGIPWRTARKEFLKSLEVGQ